MGLPGPQGPPGPPGPQGLETVWELSGFSGDFMQALAVSCPVGKVVAAGGYILQAESGIDQTTISANVNVSTSAPSGETHWYIEAYETGLLPENWRIIGYARCATDPSP